MSVEPKPFAEIAARGTVRDISLLLEQYRDAEAWPDAVDALERVLARAQARGLIWLEANLRSIWSGYRFYGARWNALEPENVPQLRGSVMRLATFHGNGRVREAAVRELASRSAPDAIAYLLFRANDWVSQVSTHASAALEQALTPANAAAWIAALPLEGHVRSLRRRSLAYLFDRAKDLAVAPAARAALSSALRDGATDVRRACASLVSSLPSNQQTPLYAAPTFVEVTERRRRFVSVGAPRHGEVRVALGSSQRRRARLRFLDAR